MTYEKTTFVNNSAPYINANYLNGVEDALYKLCQKATDTQLSGGRNGAMVEVVNAAQGTLKATRKIVVGSTNPSSVTGLVSGDIYIYCPTLV